MGTPGRQETSTPTCSSTVKMKTPQPETGFKELQRLPDRLIGRLSPAQLVPARPEETLPAGPLCPSWAPSWASPGVR